MVAACTVYFVVDSVERGLGLPLTVLELNSCLDSRRKKMVPGGLMKAVVRPGGGESTPSDGDQVSSHTSWCLISYVPVALVPFRSGIELP